jgi:ribosomal protein S18 acetylase RimI-like enzyme
VDVRTATGADADAIERIRVRGWQAAYRHVFPPEALDRLPVDPSRWQEHLAHPPAGHACFVADQDGQLLGFVTIGPSKREPARYGELHGLYVDPDVWSTGVGRALTERAEEVLALTWREAVLWVLEDNPRARRFYEAAGWTYDGVRDSFERLGVEATIVRYRKRFTRSVSR